MTNYNKFYASKRLICVMCRKLFSNLPPILFNLSNPWFVFNMFTDQCFTVRFFSILLQIGFESGQLKTIRLRNSGQVYSWCRFDRNPRLWRRGNCVYAKCCTEYDERVYECCTRISYFYEGSCGNAWIRCEHQQAQQEWNFYSNKQRQ